MAETADRPNLCLEMRSQALLLTAARSMVAAVAQRMGFDEASCGQISLAVNEAICNIINHGYDGRDDGIIWLRVWVQPNLLYIELEDEAKQVDPATIKSRDLDEIRPGGLGVHLMREVMDEVRFEKRQSIGMRLTMIKKLPALPAEPDAQRGEDTDHA